MSILSEKIKVFPSTRRAAGNSLYRESRLLSEGSVVDTNNRVLDNTSYVNTNNVGAIDTAESFDFIIYGYHFTITSVNDILSTIQPSLLVDGVDIYASIEIDTEGGVSELIGQDEDDGGNSIYNGIVFSTTQPTVPVSGDVIKYLKILHKEDGNYYVPTESIEKYNIQKMSGNIDCGEIL